MYYKYITGGVFLIIVIYWFVMDSKYDKKLEYYMKLEELVALEKELEKEKELNKTTKKFTKKDPKVFFLIVITLYITDNVFEFFFVYIP